MNDTESAIKRIISDKAPKEYNVSVLFYGKSKYYYWKIQNGSFTINEEKNM